MTLQFVQGTPAGSARIHVDVEGLMVQAALVDGLIIVHGHLLGRRGMVMVVNQFLVLGIVTTARATTHLDVVIHPLVDGQAVLVQTVGQRAQDVRVPGLLVATDDHHNHKDQEDDDGHEDSHQDSNVIVLWILVDGLGRDYWMGEIKFRN